ncbi:MAG: hypothetical protein DRQ59_00200 [Gammaproteobacteria bacterium]|nr:MAG: hypothetical protein DRQ59_00200 [Gammaproteobacteria bacterium]
MFNLPDNDHWHLLNLLKLVIAASEPQSSALWIPAVRRFGQARDDGDFGLKLSAIAARLSYS